MNTIDFLKQNEYKRDAVFLKEAQFLKDNWAWLKYSTVIALKVRRRMDELGWTQKKLAEALECSQQHVSILLNGKVNMTLETIAKLEKALNFNLIGDALTLTDGYSSQTEHKSHYLNAPAPGEEVDTTGCSALVDGYTPRKKKGPKKMRKEMP